MNAPIVLRTPKQRRYWLVFEGTRGYRPVAPSRLRMRLRELGFASHCQRLGRALRPAPIADAIGAVVTPSIFAAAEQGGEP
jgi:hypothetical protein